MFISGHIDLGLIWSLALLFCIVILSVSVAVSVVLKAIKQAPIIVDNQHTVYREGDNRY